MSGVIEILDLIVTDPWPFRDMSEQERSALNSRIREIDEMLRRYPCHPEG